MERFQTTGIFGLALLALVPAFVLADIVMAALRVSRGVAVAMLVAGLGVPLAVGAVGMVASQHSAD